MIPVKPARQRRRRLTRRRFTSRPRRPMAPLGSSQSHHRGTPLVSQGRQLALKHTFRRHRRRCRRGRGMDPRPARSDHHSHHRQAIGPRTMNRRSSFRGGRQSTATARRSHLPPPNPHLHRRSPHTRRQHRPERQHRLPLRPGDPRRGGGSPHSPLRRSPLQALRWPYRSLRPVRLQRFSISQRPNCKSSRFFAIPSTATAPALSQGLCATTESTPQSNMAAGSPVTRPLMVRPDASPWCSRTTMAPMPLIGRDDLQASGENPLELDVLQHGSDQLASAVASLRRVRFRRTVRRVYP